MNVVMCKLVHVFAVSVNLKMPNQKQNDNRHSH